ncbi:hypothetical protein [Dyadobacter sp. CECT 9623]|nr:hypothetical protein [Dyadobacter sp. CECT 9623]
MSERIPSILFSDMLDSVETVHDISWCTITLESTLKLYGELLKFIYNLLEKHFLKSSKVSEIHFAK